MGPGAAIKPKRSGSFKEYPIASTGKISALYQGVPAFDAPLPTHMTTRCFTSFMPGTVVSLARLAPLWLMLSLPLPSQAIIFFSTPDPSFNTSAPTGDLADSGWDLQGRWGTFLGTPIAPNLFITAKHVGGAPGQTFSFRGVNYPAVDSFADPQSDLRIFKVCGIFPAFAGLYATSDEIGRRMMIFGRGTRRGVEVQGDAAVGTELKGWQWGAGDGVVRWGTNVVSTVSGAIEGLGQLLAADFDAGAGASECHLSSGDSGGAIFIHAGGTWKLAGINYAVDGPFNTANSGPGFMAALFDVGGLFQRNALTGTWDYAPPNPVIDTPSAFYATRISANLAWINSTVAQHAVQSLPPVLEFTSDLNQPFATHLAYTVDEPARTITIAAPTSSLFLRLKNCLAHQIVSTEQVNGQWLIHYGP